MKFFTIFKYIIYCFFITYGILLVMNLIHLSMGSPEVLIDLLKKTIRMPFDSTLGTIIFCIIGCGSLLCTFLSIHTSDSEPPMIESEIPTSDDGSRKQLLPNYHYAEIVCVNYDPTLDFSMYDPGPLANSTNNGVYWLILKPGSNTVIGRMGYIQMTASSGFIHISITHALRNDPSLNTIYDACFLHLKLHAFNELKLQKIVYKSYTPFDNEQLQRQGFLLEGKTKERIQDHIYTAKYWTYYNS